MRKMFNVTGLAFGDEGKGHMVDYLVRRYDADLVVRYNGGAQAAHNVVTDDGRHHTFSQLGSGSFAGARTHLAGSVMVNPSAFLNELTAFKLTNADFVSRDMVTVDRECPVTTPFHVALNRLIELSRRDGRHGSCGMGIGETAQDVLAGTALRVKDLVGKTQQELTDVYASVQQRMAGRWSEVPGSVSGVEADRAEGVLLDTGALDLAVTRAMNFLRCVQVVDETWLFGELQGSYSGRPAVFEGAQGVLLDETFGFAPHVTWSDTTDRGFRDLWMRATDTYADRTDHSYAVLRAYATRHGAGPLPTESSASGLRHEKHNGQNDWQGHFRTGHLDLALAKYALDRLSCVDGLALTWLDAVGASTKVCVGYENLALPTPAESHPFTWEKQLALGEQLRTAVPVYETIPATRLVRFIEDFLGVPVAFASYGPCTADVVNFYR